MHYGLSEYLQLLVSGLSTGSIYVLIALGLITIYNVTGVVNLAQGEFVMVGGMLAVVGQKAGLPLAAAFVLAVAATMALGALCSGTTIHPARHAPDVTLIITPWAPPSPSAACAAHLGTPPRKPARVHPRRAGGHRRRHHQPPTAVDHGCGGSDVGILFLFLRYTLLGKAVTPAPSIAMRPPSWASTPSAWPCWPTPWGPASAPWRHRTSPPSPW
jgi:hypothetical protein